MPNCRIYVLATKGEASICENKAIKSSGDENESGL